MREGVCGWMGAHFGPHAPEAQDSRSPRSLEPLEQNAIQKMGTLKSPSPSIFFLGPSFLWTGNGHAEEHANASPSSQSWKWSSTWPELLSTPLTDKQLQRAKAGMIQPRSWNRGSLLSKETQCWEECQENAEKSARRMLRRVPGKSGLLREVFSDHLFLEKQRKNGSVPNNLPIFGVNPTISKYDFTA